MPINYDDGQSVYDNNSSTWDPSSDFPTPPAIGSRADIFARLKALFPRSWFQKSPNFDATLQGPAWALSNAYAQITYAALQTRIKTATDGYLDLISNDFFGAGLPRLTQESDNSFRARILANLFIKGPTRRDMNAVLTLITGRAPSIFEPGNTTDSGGWGGGAYFDVAGGWGDPLPFQSFVTAYRPVVGSVSLGELSTYRFNFDTNAYWSDAQPGSITDAAIIAAVETTRALGTTVWLRILSQPVTP
jgi:hypothetical protein